MRKLNLFATSLAVLSSLALVGCGGGTTPSTNPGGSTNTPSTNTPSGETVKLTVWGPTEQNEVLTEMVKRFKAAYPETNYDITVGIVSEADAFGSLSKDVTVGADVYAFPNDQLVNLLRIGALAKIGGAFLEEVEENNSASSVNAGNFNGDQYAYPLAADNGYFMFYDKSTLGTNTDRLDDVLAALAAKNQKFAIDLDNSWYEAGFFFATGCSYNVEYDEEGKEKTIECDFNSANGVIAAKAMMKLAANPAFLKADTNDVITNGFGDGTVGAAVTGTWNADAIKEHLGDNYAAVKLPKFTVDGTDYQLSSFAGYKLLGVNPNSKNVVEAHRLAAFLTNEEMQAYRFAEKAVGPTNTKVAASDAVKENIALAALAEQSKYAVAQASVPSNYWSAVDAFGAEIVAGSVTNENVQTKLNTMVALIKTISAAN